MTKDKICILHSELIWMNYSSDFEDAVEALFDEEAVRFTACDDGFKAFYDYWLAELGADNFFCKLAFLNERLISIIALAGSDEGFYTIQEFVIAPDQRGKGYGTMILKELLKNSNDIIGADIQTAEAVIFPNNSASQRAFAKAGFEFVKSHPDGDALYFRYNKNIVL